MLTLINRETDYALRILHHLSERDKATAEAICGEELVPTPFAYKILRKLTKGGLVRAARGVDGGFSLSCDLGALTLLDLMAALGSSELVNACMKDGFVCPRRDSLGGECAIHSSLCEVQREIDSLLRSRTLASVLGKV